MAEITFALHCNILNQILMYPDTWIKVLDKGGEPEILENVVCD